MMRSVLIRRFVRSELKSAVLVLVLALTCLTTAVQAQGLGDLMVLPTRVVLEGQKRYEVLTVLNRGVDTATYSISFLQYRMTEKGELQEITTPETGQRFADPMVRFFPKQVVLAPGESQNVRLQVTKPDSLAPGEYRSHLYFRAVPREAVNAVTTTDTNGLSVRLTPVFGISIPVIVRHGEVSAAVTISQPSIITDGTRKLLTFNLERTGNRSVYGDVVVTMHSQDGANSTVGQIKGVSVYTPNSVRNLQLPVTLPADAKGSLTITYRSTQEGGTQTLMAEREYPLP